MSLERVLLDVPLVEPVANPNLLRGFDDNSRPGVLMIGRIADRGTFSTPTDLTDNPYYREGAFRTYLKCEPARTDGNSLVYDVPGELLQFSEAIIKIAQFEHSNFPDTQYGRIHAAAKQSYVPPLGAQLTPTKHRDDAPLISYREPGQVTGMRIYAVSDRNPTVFTHDRKEISAEDYEIAAATQATYHYSPRLLLGGRRTFFYMSYAFGVARFEHPVRALSMQR